MTIWTNRSRSTAAAGGIGVANAAGSRTAAWLMAGLMLALCPSQATTWAAVMPTAADADGSRMQIWSIDIAYADSVDTADFENLPPANWLLETDVKLTATEGGYIAWRAGREAVDVRLSGIGSLPDRVFYQSAVDRICRAVEAELLRRGFSAVVTPADAPADAGSLTPALSLVVSDLAARPIPKPAPRAEFDDGPRFAVRYLGLIYQPEHPDLPPIDKLNDAAVTLSLSRSGYIAARPGLETVQTTVGQVSELPVDQMHASAIRQISRAVVAKMNELGVHGVTVEPAPGQFGAGGVDLRAKGDATLWLVVRARPVSVVRSEGRGERVDPDQRVDNPAHERIREHSPIGASDDGETDLLRRDQLDEYLHWLNRHPGRRVDVAVAAGDQPDTLSLDYIVQESKPWFLYFQVTNDGTSQTEDWRERFGFVHHQLTGNDDILTIDYVTAAFDNMNVVMASYEAPVPTLDRVRWKVYGTYSEFTASDVGLFGEDFVGERWSIGFEVAWNIYQDGPLFVDVFAGAFFENIEVDNQLFSVVGESDFLRPQVGVRVSQNRQTDNLYASLWLDFNLDDVADTTAADASKLGRFAVDPDWVILKGDIAYSFYLDPLLAGPNDPARSSRLWPMVHEVVVGVRGQYVFGDKRVIPQAQQTAGGFFTVRGYPESIIVGDNAVIASVEYRIHLPRMFEPSAEPTKVLGLPMHLRRPRAGVNPDWDLVLKAFVDAAYVSSNEAFTFEPENELISAGAGVELVLKRNVRVRVEWAAGLSDVQQEASIIEAGDELHIGVTILY